MPKKRSSALVLTLQVGGDQRTHGFLRPWRPTLGATRERKFMRPAVDAQADVASADHLQSDPVLRRIQRIQDDRNAPNPIQQNHKRSVTNRANPGQGIARREPRSL